MKMRFPWLKTLGQRLGGVLGAVLSNLRDIGMRIAALIGHALSWAVLLLLVLGIPYLSWQRADATLNEGQRLHAYFVTTRALTPGTQITATDVKVAIGYVGPEANVLSARDIIGRFVMTPMKKGHMITNLSVSERYEIAAVPEEVIVQVQMDSADAQNIAAGSVIALTREKTVEVKDEKGHAGKKTVTETLGLRSCASGEPKGLRVMSIAHSADKDKPSLLRIHLDGHQASLAPLLTLHRWKPIVLGDKACSKDLA